MVVVRASGCHANTTQGETVMHCVYVCACPLECVYVSVVRIHVYVYVRMCGPALRMCMCAFVFVCVCEHVHTHKKECILFVHLGVFVNFSYLCVCMCWCGQLRGAGEGFPVRVCGWWGCLQQCSSLSVDAAGQRAVPFCGVCGGRCSCSHHATGSCAGRNGGPLPGASNGRDGGVCSADH